MKRFWKDLKSHYRYAIYSAKSELKSEVANSYLNWIWWVLEPFCFMLIYAFIFGVVFNASEQYFPVFIFLGITAWDFFNRCLTQSVKLLKNNKSIVTKVYIPKFILLISKMFFNGYKMLFSFAIIVIMVIYFRIPITLNICYSDIYRVVCSDICLHDTSDALRSIYSGLSECNEYCSSYGILFDGHFL